MWYIFVTIFVKLFWLVYLVQVYKCFIKNEVNVGMGILVQYTMNANKIVGMAIASSLCSSTGGTNKLGYSPTISKSL